ncbi:3-deoxy-7-phosphoheptulonate synthase [Marinoscillum sp. MHG1-6]|uniref:3-deoxy-7-phosphoheptulonate synthase n=1 Tax=Marinoscillum sp. MHG1-6 TaxID=2959627 RepID=UPI002157FB40|nr:3-deoxy-7-phosphoheptulonate synthase [Marinoscillum sp. MHG1-6]
MIIQLSPDITSDQKRQLFDQVTSLKYKTNEVVTQFGTYLVGIGKKKFDVRSIGHLPGILDIHIVSDDFKLVSSKWKTEQTVIDLGDGVKIGGGHFAMMAGPCSIEGEENIYKTIEHLKANGLQIMRGGVFKPRSSPYSFRGMGIDGLKMWYKAAKEHGIKIVTEVMQVSQIEEMHDYVDVFQVGARNTQNFNLLDELGRIDKAVMIKRGISGTIDELMYSAEYVFSGGNERILLCERGIRTYERASRNTFDINAIPILKEKTHLPVIADPSHGIGLRDHVSAVALASAVAGADGIIFEIHEKPDQALSDGQQTLDFAQSSRLIHKVNKLKEVLG